MQKTIPKVICKFILAKSKLESDSLFFAIVAADYFGQVSCVCQKTGLLNKHTSSRRTVSLPIRDYLYIMQGHGGGSENGNCPSFYVLTENSLRQGVGGSKRDKIPLRNIKMVPKVYVAKNCCTFAK